MTDDRNFLVCFFNSNATIGIVVNGIEHNRIEPYIALFNYTLFISTQNIDNSKNITSIKSELNYNRSLAIVWWTFEDDNQTRYFIYDLSYMIYIYTFNRVFKIKIDLNSLMIPNTCIKREYEKRINVFPYKDQIAFSCAIEDEKIQILLYNKTNLMNDSYIINISCKNNNELSKIYFNDNKNYLIYPCFKNCSNKKYENDIDCLNKKRDEENKGENEKESNTGKKENKTSDEENNKKGNEENKNISIIIIIILVIIIILSIAFIFIFRNYCKNKNFERKWQKGKENENLMKDILSDLLPN